MNKKIRIIAEEDALLQLSSNEEFNKGSKLKSILRNCAEIILIMDENEFGAQWEDSESNIRKFVEAYDMPKPRAISGLNKIYSNPGLCYKLDPFAIWFFNKSTADLKKFRNYLGVWAINTSELTDNFFYINHSREYEKNDRINGTRGNGWGNFLEQVPGFLPPINSIVINDRYLVYNTNEVNADKIGFAGLNNLNDFVDVVGSDNQSLEDVSTLFGFALVILSTANDHFMAMVDETLDHVAKRHQLRTAVDQRNAVHGEGGEVGLPAPHPPLHGKEGLGALGHHGAEGGEASGPALRKGPPGGLLLPGDPPLCAAAAHDRLL